MKWHLILLSGFLSFLLGCSSPNLISNYSDGGLVDNVSVDNVSSEKPVVVPAALCSWSCGMPTPASDPNITVGSTFGASYEIVYFGSCLGRGSGTIQYYNGSSYQNLNSDTNLSLEGSQFNPKTCVGAGSSCSGDWTVTGSESGNYTLHIYANFNREISAKSCGYATITVNPIDLGVCDIQTVSSDLTLSADEDDCLNVTANDVTIDCNGYDLVGTQQPTYYAIYVDGYSNVTIKNCDIWNHPVGVHADYSNNLKILNSSVNNGSIEQPTGATSHGFRVSNSVNVTINDTGVHDMYSNNTNTGAVSFAEHGAIYFLNTTNNVVKNYDCRNITGMHTYSSEGFYFSVPYGACVLYDLTNRTSIINATINLTSSDYGIKYEDEYFNSIHTSVNDSTFYDSSVFLVGENVSVYNNTFIDFKSTCIYIGYADEAVIEGNNCTIQDGYGFRCFYGGGENTQGRHYNNYCDGNYVASRGLGVGANNLDVRNNVFTNIESVDSSEGIIDVDGKTGVKIINNTVSNFNASGSRSGAIYIFSNNISVANNTIINGSDGAGISLIGYDHNFTNITMINVSEAFYLYVTDDINCINCEFNKSGVVFEGACEDFEAKYTVTVNVTDSSMNPLEGVNVSFFNVSDDFIYHDNTSAGGNVTYIVTEYNQVGMGSYAEGCTGSDSNFTCYTPHNITADNTTSFNSTMLSLSEKQMVHMILYGEVVDSCTYAGSGDHTYLCSDDCKIDLTDHQSNSVYVSGAGTFHWVRNITNSPYIEINEGCYAEW